MKQQIIYPDLVGQTVFLTGAGRGIGKGIAQKLLENNCNLCVTHRGPKPRYLIGQRKSIVKFLKADVRDTNAIANWLKEYESFGGRINILINNAGILIENSLMNISRTEWEMQMDTNLKSIFFLSQVIAKHMARFKQGNIINALSFGATIPSTPSGVYAASKAALASLTKTMAGEWAPLGIRVNGYSPGVVPTRMTFPAISRARKEIVEGISMHRLGTAGEVADAVLFLASEKSAYITGVNLDVSGGKLLIQNPNIPWKNT